MLRVTGLCVGNSPVAGEFPAQMASNAENCIHLLTSSWNNRMMVPHKYDINIVIAVQKRCRVLKVVNMPSNPDLAYRIEKFVLKVLLWVFLFAMSWHVWNTASELGISHPAEAKVCRHISTPNRCVSWMGLIHITLGNSEWLRGEYITPYVPTNVLTNENGCDENLWPILPTESS